MIAVITIIINTKRLFNISANEFISKDDDGVFRFDEPRLDPSVDDVWSANLRKRVSSSYKKKRKRLNIFVSILIASSKTSAIISCF